MKIPVKPSASQKKALKAKYKESSESAQAQKQARVNFYKNDMDAERAVKHVTTPKGYDPNPLKPRGGEEDKKAPSSTMRPKFKY